MKCARPFLIAALLIFYFAQQETPAQPQLWEVYTISNQPYINVIIDNYRSDSLYIKYMDQTIVLHQDSIQFLIQKNESEAGIGIVAGLVLGGVFGYFAAGSGSGIFSDIARPVTTIISALIGGIFGGLAGASAGKNKKFKLGEMDTETKRELLTRLFPM